MYKYFQGKLDKLYHRIKQKTNDVISIVNSGTLDQIKHTIVDLNHYKLMQTEFATDAVIELTVEQVITLINAQLITHNQAENVYKYTKAVTIAERDILVKLSYQYRDIKVK